MPTNVLARNHVTITGPADGPVIVLAHGFGCDQQMWRRVLPALAADHRVVCYDLVGSGHSDLSAYDRQRHGTLDGHAEDLLAICDALSLPEVTLIGHSVSAMIGITAAVQRPELFRSLVLIAPSACFLDDPATGYVGGFSRADVDGLLDSLQSNYFAWAASIAAMAMANPDTPELAGELEVSFCHLDPDIAAHFARVTFLADCRALLPRVQTPTLLLECTDDVLAPPGVAGYLHAHLQSSTLVKLRATGHLPHVSAPQETVAAILEHLHATQ